MAKMQVGSPKSEKPHGKELEFAVIEPLLAVKNLLVKKNIVMNAVGSGSIVTDSRHLAKGDCFLAYAGVSGDAHAFIAKAIMDGAAFLIVENPEYIPDDCQVPWIQVTSGRAAWAWLMAEAYDNPQDKLTLLGVTGTNGKSSTVWMAGGLLATTATPTMTLGTLGAYIYVNSNVDFIPTNHTTPDPDQLYKLLAIAVERGVQVVAMEVSSHAIIQEKLVPLRFSALAFTSFTRDHLDFHGTMDAYFDAKWRAFTELAATNARLIFCDGIDRPLALNTVSSDCWVYGPKAFEKAKNWQASHSLSLSVKHADYSGSTISLTHDDTARTGKIPYFGRHAVENFCAALLLAETATAKLIPSSSWGALIPVPGRLETVGVERKPTVIVDYAHTPDALEKTLAVLRPYCQGELWVVFGCGGDRDRGKRSQMGLVAEKQADHVVITSDNPRTEDPSKIIDDIRSGLKRAQLALIEPDREKAIAQAIAGAAQSDTVVIAGKGHETYQIIGTDSAPFDDRKIARKYLL